MPALWNSGPVIRRVFLVSGSFEEREEYAGDTLKNQDCPIVLISTQHSASNQMRSSSSGNYLPEIRTST